VGTFGFSRLVLTRIARTSVLVGALAGALALGACGRKGPLEMPPSSNSLLSPEQQGQSPALGQEESAGFEDPRKQDMPTPRASKKTFILDPLLGEPKPQRTP
jgi:predicted small lipoprotein YifL